MEQMAVLQETSYELLYRWAQSECRTESQCSGHNMYTLYKVSILDWTELKTNPDLLRVCNVIFDS